MATYRIVVASVASDAQPAVTAALAATFGIAEAVAQQIAQSAPIVILDGLAPDHAGAVLDALDPVKEAGAQLAIAPAASGSMSLINWPAPPRIAGRAIESFKPGYVAPAAPPAWPDPMQLACPHCGRPVQMEVAVAAGQPGLAGSGASAPAQAPPWAPLPELPQVPPAKQPRRPPSSGITRPGPMDLEEFERGVGGGEPTNASADALLHQLDASLPSRGPEPDAIELRPTPPPQRKKTSPPRKPKRSPSSRRPRGRRR